MSPVWAEGRKEVGVRETDGGPWGGGFWRVLLSGGVLTEVRELRVGGHYE